MRTAPRRTALLAGVIAASLLALTGLGVAAQSPSPAPVTSQAPAADTAKVRVLHASPDAPAVDVYADGSAILTAVPFGTLSDYLEVPAGEHRIQVFATGADATKDTPVLDATLTFSAGTLTTVAATNNLASIEAQVISDSPAPVADQAQVRVVHLSADAPAVDVAPVGGDPIVTDLAYPTATDYLTVPAGSYDLEIRPTGTTDVAFTIPTLTLEAGKSYSAFAIGSLAGGTFTVLPSVDASAAAPTESPAAATAKVRVLHGSPDAPAVDVYADGAKIVGDLAFGKVTDYLVVPAGDHQIQVFPAGSDPAGTSPVIDAKLTFAPGTSTTVAAAGKVAKLAAQVFVDAPAPVADQAQVRFVHLSQDAPAVAIAADGKKKAIVKKLAYPDATDYLTVPAGTYDLQLRVAAKPAKVALDLPPVTLEAGNSYSAFAVGSAKDGTLTVVTAVDASAAG
ncbi:MAG: DUF4397 domain-containing protein [Chloroflexota bacterium]